MTDHKHFVGRTIKEVRLMTVNEQVAEGWLGVRPNPPTLAIVLDDGTAVYAQTPLHARRTDGVRLRVEEEK